MKVAAIILTTDRAPRLNYLESTLISLAQSGALSNSSFTWQVYHSGEPQSNLPTHLLTTHKIKVHYEPIKLHFNAAVKAAIELAAQHHADWVLFCEDDIAVCAEFPQFVLSQLNATAGEPIVDFVTYYDEIVEAYYEGQRFIEMSANLFYGTQCIAMSVPMALEFAHYIGNHHTTKIGFADTWIDDWLLESGRQRSILCSVPSAVQHMGVDSNHGHNFISTKGFKDDLDKTFVSHTQDFELITLKKGRAGLKPTSSSELYELNLPAQIIYLSCDGTRSIKQLVAELAAHVDEDPVLLNQQVRHCIKELRELGAVRILP